MANEFVFQAEQFVETGKQEAPTISLNTEEYTFGMSANLKYVSTTGNDSSTTPNNPSTPWLTIQKGIYNANANDTILIRGGTYRIDYLLHLRGTFYSQTYGGDPTATVNSQTGTITRPVTVRNYPGETVIIDCANTVGVLAGGTSNNMFMMLENKQYWRFHGLQFANTTVAFQLGTNVDSTNNTIQWCKFNTPANNKGGDNKGAIILNSSQLSDGTTIQYNEFYGPGQNSDGVHNNTGNIVAFRTRKLAIKNNIMSNTPCGIYFKHANEPNVSNTNIVISGNYIFKTDRFASFFNSNYAKIVNNIFASNSEVRINESNGVAGGDYNDIQYNTIVGKLVLFWDTDPDDPPAANGAIGNIVKNNIIRGNVEIHRFNATAHFTTTNYNGYGDLIWNNNISYTLPAWKAFYGQDANSVNGTIVFSGGTYPTSIDGFALTSPSIGINSAESGRNMGADVTSVGLVEFNPDSVGYVFWNTSYTPLYNIPATVFVSKTGNDSDTGNTAANSYATINKAFSRARSQGPGTVIEIKPGIYAENASALGYPYTLWENSGRVNGNPYACMTLGASGNSTNPIIIRKANEAGNVVVECQNQFAGIFLGTSGNSHVYISGLEIANARTFAIGAKGNYDTTNSVINRTQTVSNVTIENCFIHDVRGNTTNEQGIANWGSRNWKIRNNIIVGVQEDTSVTRGAGIRAFSTENCLVENNYISNDLGTGVNWKDHWIENEAGDSITESIIRYNEIISNVGVLISQRGSNFSKAGNNYIYNNTFRNFDGFLNDTGAIHFSVIGAANTPRQNTDVLSIHNNTFDGKSNANSVAISCAGAIKSIEIRGNIFLDTRYPIILYNDEPNLNVSAKTIATYIDYNLYPNTNMTIVLDRYNANGASFTNVQIFNAQTAGSFICLGADVGDNQFQNTSANLVVSTSTNNYTYTANSKAIGFMPDGTNAGAYQYGNEVIGLTEPYPSSNVTGSLGPRTVMRMFANGTIFVGEMNELALSPSLRLFANGAVQVAEFIEV